MDINMDEIYGQQLLGAVQYDFCQQQFYWHSYNEDKKNERPRFQDLVTNKVFTAHGIDRCHSLSWLSIRDIVLEILNAGGYFQDFVTVEGGIIHFSSTMTILSKYVEVDSSTIPKEIDDYKQTYTIALSRCKKKLIEKYKSCIGNEDNIDNLCKAATAYLSCLNSCIFNLRYPAAPVHNWNQSVGEGYDPRRWCYVSEDGTVLSDEKKLSIGLACGDYDPMFKKGHEGEGYYFLSKLDGILLGRLCDPAFFGKCVKTPYVHFEHGEVNRSRVMASSSNEYSRPASWREDGDTNIFYWYYGWKGL